MWGLIWWNIRCFIKHEIAFLFRNTRLQKANFSYIDHKDVVGSGATEGGKGATPPPPATHTLFLDFNFLFGNGVSLKYGSVDISKKESEKVFLVFVCWQDIYIEAARRYEVYLRVVKTIFYEWAQRMSKILFLPREDKLHNFKPPCNVLFII